MSKIRHSRKRRRQTSKLRKAEELRNFEVSASSSTDGDSDDGSGLGFPQFPLNFSAVERNQKKRLRIRLSRSKRHKGRRLEAVDSSSSEEERSDHVKDAWDIVIQTLPKLFFSEESACFLNVEEKQIYCGVQASHKCFLDLKAIYNQNFEAHGQLGHEPAMYKGLKSVVGQLIRFLVASGKISKASFKSVSREGSLFRAANNRDSVKVFIGQFKSNNAVSTVADRAAQLVKFSDHSESFIVSTRDVVKEKIAASIADFLRGTVESDKRESRKKSAIEKSHFVRSRLNNVLLPADFGASSTIASNKQIGLRQSFSNMVKRAPESNRRKLLYRYFEKKPKVLQKWNINFISFLVLNGGGQRSQAYCQVQCPPMSQIRALRKTVKRDGCFSLPTLREKRTRDTDFPEVLFPGAVFSFLTFHAEYIRPYLIVNSRSEILPLLIDTRYPRALKECSILSTVRCFLRNSDPELASLTMINIRSSYATMAITMYRRGKMFKEMNEDSFLIFLAKIMNNSQEMIKQTNRTCTRQNTMEAASRLANLVQNIEYGDENREDEEMNVEISSSDEDICETIDPPNKHDLLCFKLMKESLN